MPIVSDVTGTFPFSRLSPFVSLIPHIWPITPLYAYRMTWKSLQEADLGLLTTCALLNGARVDVIWHNRKANLSHVLSAPRRPVLRGRTEIRFEIWGSCGKLERVCAKCVQSALSWETRKGRRMGPERGKERKRGERRRVQSQKLQRNIIYIHWISFFMNPNPLLDPLTRICMLSVFTINVCLIDLFKPYGVRFPWSADFHEYRSSLPLHPPGAVKCLSPSISLTSDR